ncbi:MAG: AAA family ATPase, partial [Acidobacteriota bacterium]
MIDRESPQIVGDRILAAGGEEQEAGWSHDHPRMIVRSAFQFLERDFPPMEPIAGSVFLAPQIVMVYARPGVGKTYFSLTFAMALALGQHVDVCGWRVGEKPLPVLYVDGEMDGEEMQERIENLLRGSGTWQTRTEPSLHILSRADMFDATGKGIPDLSDPLGREAIEDAIDQVGAKVVIIDNLSSLVIKGDENSSEDWAEINQWLLRLRAKGLHVMVVHHAGKSGAQRGSSKREDNVNMIVKLEHPEDYEASDLG